MPRKRKPDKGVNVFTLIDFEKHQVTDFISQAEAARQLDITRATVNFLVSSGKLRSAEFAGRRVVFVEDVLNYKPIRPGPKKGAKSRKLAEEAKSAKGTKTRKRSKK